MKTKKKGVLTFAVIILAAAVIFAVFSPSVRTAFGNIGISDITGKDLQNVNDIVLISHCKEVEGKKNSVAGVKEAVRLGATGVCVDLCFRSDNIPVITDSYDDAENAQTLEELFSAMSDEKYSEIKLYLNIVQLSSLSELNRLAVEYNIASRVTLIGIDSAHYGLITSNDTIIPFYITVDITPSVAASAADGTFTVPEEYTEYGASGMVIDRSSCSSEIVGALSDFGIPVLVTGVENGRQMCKALLTGAKAVYVENIKNSAEIYSGWIESMQERYKSSVEQSLSDLSSAE